MFVLQVRKKTLLQRIQKMHTLRVHDWKQNGSAGKKPKLYETVEDVVEQGLNHFDNPHLPRKQN